MRNQSFGGLGSPFLFAARRREQNAQHLLQHPRFDAFRLEKSLRDTLTACICFKHKR
ncbi:unknown protein [Bathycoccus prasinos]|uniref:Uncharacterized protein n=1 Tax=Bathycoccus prasinos TaxID=41875 RepID=K8F450_9CHLO|nr:unknown protein [Bathycoccus prasinos]CCO66812.1 unknown protein [Bathycoccus prasinos]|eukprot:XP_007511252.1 unknown protein [Bathycoccus prasinos]